MPLKSFIIIPFGKYFIFGSLSMILNILLAAIFPYATFFKLVGKWLIFNPMIIMLKIIVKIAPAVYFWDVIDSGQWFVCYMQLAPNQNPSE